MGVPYPRRVIANPQAENGHVDIANEIMEALVRTRIPGEARQIFDFIIRKTYGWRKKEDAISLSQFQEATGLRRSHVCKAIQTLLKMNLIVKKGGGSTQKGTTLITTYGFQKDYDTWVVPKRRLGGSPQKGTGVVPKRVIGVVPKRGHTKDTNTKDTNTKDKVFVDPRVKLGIDHYFQTFKSHFGTPPVIQGAKDATIIKSLLEYMDLEELQYLMDQFFASSDEWIMRSGYTIGAFKSQVNKLKLGERRKLSPEDMWLLTKEEQDRREENGKKRQTPLQIGHEQDQVDTPRPKP